MNKNCVFCGKKIGPGKDNKKFCSDSHRINYYRKVNKERYIILNRKHQKTYREKYKKLRYCIVCGNVLGARKRKFCGYKCQFSYNKRTGLDSRWLQNTKYYPLYCDECKGNIIQMSDGEMICKKCGLVFG